MCFKLVRADRLPEPGCGPYMWRLGRFGSSASAAPSSYRHLQDREPVRRSQSHTTKRWPSSSGPRYPSPPRRLRPAASMRATLLSGFRSGRRQKPATSVLSIGTAMQSRAFRNRGRHKTRELLPDRATGIWRSAAEIPAATTAAWPERTSARALRGFQCDRRWPVARFFRAGSPSREPARPALLQERTNGLPAMPSREDALSFSDQEAENSEIGQGGICLATRIVWPG